MFEWLNKGGPFMYVILGVSFVSLGLIIERVYVLWFKYRINASQFLSHILSFVDADNFTRAIEVCNLRPDHPLAMVLKAGLLKANRGDKEIQRSMEEAAARVMPKLAKRTNYLSMLSNVSTLLGLLGTIFGLIEAFSGIGAADAAQKQEILAKGISTAMGTTAFGLIVAIPTMVAFSVLVTRQNMLSETIEEGSITLFNRITSRNAESRARAAG
ncbi:MAG: MotA/TolQ/ExbB proton channel family protein [Pseudomonadota bacterium]